MSPEIYYLSRGSGKPVVLVHGWAMQGGVWNDFAAALAHEYQPVAVDLRGHGKSAGLPGPYSYDAFASDLEALILDLRLEKVTMAGWSMGAQILMKLLARHCPQIDSLIFISGNPSLIQRPGYENGLPPVVVKRLLRRTERDCADGLRFFRELLFTAEERAAMQGSDWAAGVADPAAAPVREAALQSLQCLYEQDLRSALEGICLPTLIIQGGQDPICVSGAARYMHSRVRGSRMVFLEKAGHVPFVTRREEVLQAVRRFLDEVSGKKD